ncbi:glycosyl transferase family 2 [Pseudodesulfovibrio mercurii]|uniref:Glycosyl transferase family 2 n=1 Tax=Pseudodesulfovibrio mercurii TaxID=641491 RepID=F0JDY8_9BACT|nr:glycosyltransferase family 2 protein [Pseudodesulfovibrio mercurii]EGB13428.1 glycosyl transferase family 2 [Pseudodesulfovibrio mercurii]
MINPSRVAVIIPALNEAPTIGSVVEQVRQLGCAVYVVDDNSADTTYGEAVAAGAEVLRLPYTAGAWMAVQAGLRHALRRAEHDCFITMDGDGQHKPRYIPELIREFEREDANTLIGSCPQRGSRARKFAWRLFARLTGLGIVDLTSGFRVYDHKALDVLLSGEGALLDYQDIGVLLLLRRKGLVCREHAIGMCERVVGHSRIFDTWLDVGQYLVKTFIWIFVDWITGSGRKSREQEGHDAF